MKKTITLFLFLFAGVTVFAQDELRARMELKNAKKKISCLKIRRGNNTAELTSIQE